MSFDNPSAAYAAANPDAKAGDTFTVGGITQTYDPAAAGVSKAPVTQNKRVDPQPNPGKFPLVQVTSTPTSVSVDSHDPTNMGNMHAKMNKDGYWTTTHQDGDGNTSSIKHGVDKSSSQAKSSDSVGHSDERVGGGSRSQAQNGTHHENGEHETKAVAGAVTAATESSGKIYSKGGDGHMHHAGDLTFAVEEGGVHYNVAQDFSVTATGGLIHLNSSGDITVDSSGSNITVTSPTQITFKVGSSSIVMTPAGITMIAPRIDLNP